MNELVRPLATWLAGGSGINAALALVPRDGADPAPANVADVADQTNDLEAAQRRFAEGVSPQAVVLSGPVRWVESGPIGGNVRDGEADVVVRLMAASVAPTAVRDLSTTLRATERSVRAWAATQPVTNGVQVWQLIRLERSPIDANVDDNVTTAALTATVRARETGAA